MPCQQVIPDPPYACNFCGSREWETNRLLATVRFVGERETAEGCFYDYFLRHLVVIATTQDPGGLKTKVKPRFKTLGTKSGIQDSRITNPFRLEIL